MSETYIAYPMIVGINKKVFSEGNEQYQFFLRSSDRDFNDVVEIAMPDNCTKDGAIQYIEKVCEALKETVKRWEPNKNTLKYSTSFVFFRDLNWK